MYCDKTRVDHLLRRREIGANVARQLKICMLRRFICTNTVQDYTLKDIFIAKNGYTLVSGHSSNEIKIWELGTNLQLVSTKKADYPISSVAIFEYKNTSMPATVSLSPISHSVSIEAYCSSFSKSDFSYFLPILDPNFASNDSVHISANGQVGITSNVGNHPRPWDFTILGLKTVEVIARISTFLTVTHGISSNGNAVVFFSSNGMVEIWSLKTKQCQLFRHAEFVNIAECAAISDDGNTVFSGHRGRYADIVAWDVDKHRFMDMPCSTGATCLALCDGDDILVSGHKDGSIRVWSFDILRRSYDCLFTSPDADKHRAKVKKISIADSMTILSCDKRGGFKIWQPGH